MGVSLKLIRGIRRGEAMLSVSVLLSLYRGAFVDVDGDAFVDLVGGAFVDLVGDAFVDLVGVVVKVVVNVAWLLLQLDRFLDLTDGEGCLCLTF